MSIISFRQVGDFSKLKKYLEKQQNLTNVDSVLHKYAQEGVRALAAATPFDTGKTASSWNYIIEKKNGRSSISFTNSNVNSGVPIAIILQYGHGTKNGGWVQGVDYINPAIRPVFEKIANEAWKEVTKV